MKLNVNWSFIFMIFSSCITCQTANKTHSIKLSKGDKFPHNIDEDFLINVSHQEIENHNIYAMFILQVNCYVTSNIEKNFIYPGFTKIIDHRLKETLFHIIEFEAKKFNTRIILRFYKEAQDCSFIVEYSAAGAEHIHLRLPVDSVVIYTTTIVLFRPPKLDLSILSEDGHQGGLSIGKRGIIFCRVSFGFPLISPTLSFSRKVSAVARHETVDDSVSMDIVPKLNDHGSLVSCKSGAASVTSKINVFHHALSVQIVPSKQQRFRQGSKIECQSHGGGFPTPTAQWTVSGINNTSKRYFTISSSKSVSTIQIGARTPNESHWILNCSSINVIPPLDRSGPHMLLNITIGDHVASSSMLASYLWIIAILVSVIVVVLAIVIVCASSHLLNCRRKPGSVPNEVPLLACSSSPGTHTDRGDLSSKEQDCYV